jgi:hypothetical protein
VGGCKCDQPIRRDAGVQVMPTINVRDLVQALQRQSDSPVCQCQQPKPRGVVLCDACERDAKRKEGK